MSVNQIDSPILKTNNIFNETEIKLHSNNLGEINRKYKQEFKNETVIQDEFQNLNEKEKMIKLNKQDSYLKNFLTVIQTKFSFEQEKKKDKKNHKIDTGKFIIF